MYTCIEHEHSVCILIARVDKYYKNGQWHTWINYDRYHELIQKHYLSGGTFTFKSEDYTEVTPSWSIYKSKERGFDPIDNRYYQYIVYDPCYIIGVYMTHMIILYYIYIYY